MAVQMMERRRGAIFFGAVGAGCALTLFVLIRVLLSEGGEPMANLLAQGALVGTMGYAAAAASAYLLWPLLKFESRVGAWVSGVGIALLAHVFFSVLYVGANIVFAGYPVESAASGFLGMILFGGAVAILPETVIGGVAGLMWHARAGVTA